MVSTFEIESTLYKVLKPIVIDEISGGVFLGDQPDPDEKENVTINTITSKDTYPQSSILNVNIHVKGLHDRQANRARMKEILDLIYPALDSKSHTVDGITLHTYIEDDKGVFLDPEVKGKFMYNIRLMCKTFKD